MDVLVADDDPVSRRLVTYTLSKLGHTPREATSSERAWQQWRRRPVPMVITNWQSASMDGLELARRIRGTRARTGHAYTYVILLTGADSRAVLQTAVEAGIDDVLEKPLDPRLLNARLTVAARHTMFANLSSGLPLCISCKSVKDPGADWTRLEDFFHRSHGLHFSHGYCPDCYFAQSLMPALLQAAGHPEPPQPSPHVVDRRRLLHIAQQDADLLMDLLDNTIESRDLLTNQPRYYLASHAGPHLQVLVDRAMHLGAGDLFRSAMALQAARRGVDRDTRADLDRRVRHHLSQVVLALEPLRGALIDEDLTSGYS